MEGYILELALELGHLDSALEEFDRHEDITNDAFLACQYDRLVHARSLIQEALDALKEYLED